MVHPDDRETLIESWEGALAGAYYDVTHRIVVGGHIKWVREVAELEFDEEGILLAGFGTVQDVTEQNGWNRPATGPRRTGTPCPGKDRRDKTTGGDPRSRERCHYRYRHTGEMVFWNTGAVQTYGFTRDDLAGKDHHAVLNTSFPIPIGNILAIVESSGRWEGELTQTTKDARQIVVLSRWAMRRGHAGRPPEILEINTDITTRRQAEEALRLASVYNRSLIEASLDPLITIDLEGMVSDVNSATELITGYSRTDLIGTDHADCFTQPKRRARVTGSSWKKVSCGTTRWRYGTGPATARRCCTMHPCTGMRRERSSASWQRHGTSRKRTGSKDT
jgi:PAS domain S-box-containing protein